MEENYNENQFKAAVRKALIVTENVLGTARKPTLAEDIDHVYEDKYLLVETQLSAVVVAATSALNITAEQLHKLVEWSQQSFPVNLHFSYSANCVFINKNTREVKTTPKQRVEHKIVGITMPSFTVAVTETVTDYFWNHTSEWTLEACRGTGRTLSDRLQLNGRNATQTIWTMADKAPFSRADFDAKNFTVRVAIDRLDKNCHTPRRNPVVKAALHCFNNLNNWCSNVQNIYRIQMLPVYKVSKLLPPTTIESSSPLPSPAIDIPDVQAAAIFVPMLFFEPIADVCSFLPIKAVDFPDGQPAVAAASLLNLAPLAHNDSPLMNLQSINLLLHESFRQLKKQCSEAGQAIVAANELSPIISKA